MGKEWENPEVEDLSWQVPASNEVFANAAGERCKPTKPPKES